MIKIFTSKISFVTALALVCLPALSQQKLGIFDGQADVGTNVKPGAGTYIPQTGQYVISGAGYNIWFDHDEFHYVYKKKGRFYLVCPCRICRMEWRGGTP